VSVEERNRLDELVSLWGVWEEAKPYLHLMVDEEELELLVAIQGKAVTTDEVAGLLGIARERAVDLVQRCYARCILDRVVEGGDAPLEAGSHSAKGYDRYSAASFTARLNHFAKFESWDDIPPRDRRAIDRRFLDEFIARHRPNVERKMLGLEAENALPNDAIFLLSEVEEMLEAATHIVVQPCDCRRLGQNCDRPVTTCIWLDDSALEVLDRGCGQTTSDGHTSSERRRLTKEEAKELVRWADRKGLMHTADSEWQTRGLHAICNCCACDCYPFRAGQELGSKGVWPKSRWVAVHDQELCNLCGACVKRCHFDAFYHDGTTALVGGKEKENVSFDRDRCWGCGLCANTCPTGAIVMESLEK